MKSETATSRAADAASTAKKKVSDVAGDSKKAAQNAKREAQALGHKLETSGRQAFDNAQAFAGSVQDVRGQLSDALSQHATQRPYLAMGAAAGLGFVLAGGLTVRLTSKLVSIGARLALSAAVKRLMDPSSA